MEVLNKIVDALISNFDFAFMLSVNVLTFIIIKIIDELNKEQRVSTWIKRFIAVICGAGLAVLFFYSSDVKLPILIYSFILSLVSWDFIFRPIVKIIKKGYK